MLVQLLVLKPPALIPSNQFKNRAAHSHPSCILHEAIGKKTVARLICKWEIVTLASCLRVVRKIKKIIILPFSPKGSHIIVYLVQVEKEENLLKLWLLDFFVEVYHHMYTYVFVCVLYPSFIALY